jgi:hypothetical protein
LLSTFSSYLCLRYVPYENMCNEHNEDRTQMEVLSIVALRLWLNFVCCCVQNSLKQFCSSKKVTAFSYTCTVVRVKLSLCLTKYHTKHHSMKAYWGEWRYS